MNGGLRISFSNAARATKGFNVEPGGYNPRITRSSKGLDFALFNFGGIRGTLNKGKITQHDLFTIMPWKNSATIVQISGKKVLELVEYIDSENLAHHSAGLEIVLKNNDTTDIKIKQ